MEEEERLYWEERRRYNEEYDYMEWCRRSGPPMPPPHYAHRPYPPMMPPYAPHPPHVSTVAYTLFFCRGKFCKFTQTKLLYFF